MPRAPWGTRPPPGDSCLQGPAPLTPPGRSHAAFGVSGRCCAPVSSRPAVGALRRPAHGETGCGRGLEAAGDALCFLLCPVVIFTVRTPCCRDRAPVVITRLGVAKRSARVPGGGGQPGAPRRPHRLREVPADRWQLPELAGNREAFLQPSRKCHWNDFHGRFLPGRGRVPAARPRRLRKEDAFPEPCLSPRLLRFFFCRARAGFPPCSPRGRPAGFAHAPRVCDQSCREAAPSSGAGRDPERCGAAGGWRFLPLPGEAVGTGAREALRDALTPRAAVLQKHLWKS